MKSWLSYFSVLLLAGCSVFSNKDDVAPPAKLTDVVNALNVQILWQVDIGKGNVKRQAELKLAIAGDRVFAVDVSGKVSALSRLDGQRLWQVNTKQTIAAGIGFADDVLVLATTDGDIVALSAKDGAQRWKINVASEVLTVPQIQQDMVVVRLINGDVLGLSASDGREQWRYSSTVPLLSLRGDSTPILINNTVLIGQANGELAGLALDSGSVLWKQRIAVSHGRSQLGRMVDVDADMAVDDGVVYATAFQGKVAAITIDSGTLLWGNDSLYGHKGLDVDYSQLYVTDERDLVWALDRYNGSALWKQDKLTYRQLTAPVVHGNYIVVADFEGYVHWLARDDGRFVARMRFAKKGINTTPIVDDDTLFILDNNGQVSALQLKL